MYTPITCIS